MRHPTSAPPPARALLALGAAILAPALLGACGKQGRLEAQASLIDARGPALTEGQALLVAPPVLLHELPGAVERDPFHDNSLVGNIWFSGGYEILEEEGHQPRSVSYTIDKEAAYAEQVRAWVDTELRPIAQEAGYAPSTLERAVLPEAPIRRKERGSNVLSSKDNRNLPVWSYEPRALPEAAREGLEGQVVLVPLVVHYYTHNGGWFVGQEQGTSAGARFRLLWTVYDGDNGAVLAWGDAGARRVIPYHYTPSTVELEDLQLAVEHDVRAILGHQLEGSALRKGLNSVVD